MTEFRLYVVLAGYRFHTDPWTTEESIGDLMEEIQNRRPDLSFGAEARDDATEPWREF